MKRYTALLLILLLVSTLVASCSSNGNVKETKTNDFQLTILHNNDGESHLVNLGSGLEDFGGIAQFAGLVDIEKKMALEDSTWTGESAVITVSSGDNFLAGVEFAAGQKAGTYYDAQALDLVGYDAICLGNHDFDFGPDVLAEFIKQVSTNRATFLSANLDFSGEPVLRFLLDEGRLAKSRVIEGKNIGIIGATTPELSTLSSPRKVKVIQDVAAAIQAEVDRLEKSGVNKIILLSHMQDIQADFDLLKELQGVDVMVAGGGDELLANEPCDLLIPDFVEPFGPYPMMFNDRVGTSVPVITTAGQYSYLGKFVVIFDEAGHYVRYDADNSYPIRICSTDNPDIVSEDREECLRRSTLVITEENIKAQNNIVNPLIDTINKLKTENIATSQVRLTGFRSDVRSRETNQGDLMADAMLWQASRLAVDYGASLPDVALLNGGAIRNDSMIPPGNISTLDTLNMAPFSNMVTVVEGVTRTQFKEILENCVSLVSEGDGRFAQISGFSFEWTSTGTKQELDSYGNVIVPGTRVQKIVLDSGAVIVGGGRVISGDPINVATTDFQARGGDQYPFRNAQFYALGVTYQQALANYIQFSDGLGGVIQASDYPDSGEGRIVRLN